MASAETQVPMTTTTWYPKSKARDPVMKDEVVGRPRLGLKKAQEGLESSAGGRGAPTHTGTHTDRQIHTFLQPRCR